MRRMRMPRYTALLMAAINFPNLGNKNAPQVRGVVHNRKIRLFLGGQFFGVSRHLVFQFTH